MRDCDQKPDWIWPLIFFLTFLGLLAGLCAVPICPVRADEAFPASDSAVGQFYACNGESFCQDVEQGFGSMEGCQVGMMPFMAQWIGDHDGFRLKTGRYECRPKAQVRV